MQGRTSVRFSTWYFRAFQTASYMSEFGTRNLSPDSSVRLAVAALGNGMKLSAVDTVPFALWCAGRSLDDYDEALWLTVSALGDRETTCAIVGGIVALSCGTQDIPDDWLKSREPLPDW
jgi:ADP-ribosylglycohydrolase